MTCRITASPMLQVRAPRTSGGDGTHSQPAGCGGQNFGHPAGHGGLAEGKSPCPSAGARAGTFACVGELRPFCGLVMEPVLLLGLSPR